MLDGQIHVVVDEHFNVVLDSWDGGTHGRR